jgi:hypothetical protein
MPSVGSGIQGTHPASRSVPRKAPTRNPCAPVSHKPTSVQRGFYSATLHVLVWSSTAHLPEHPGDEGQ